MQEVRHLVLQALPQAAAAVVVAVVAVVAAVQLVAAAAVVGLRAVAAGRRHQTKPWALLYAQEDDQDYQHRCQHQRQHQHQQRQGVRRALLRLSLTQLGRLAGVQQWRWCWGPQLLAPQQPLARLVRR